MVLVLFFHGDTIAELLLNNDSGILNQHLRKQPLKLQAQVLNNQETYQSGITAEDYVQAYESIPKKRGNRTVAPYFFVPGTNSDTDFLPLQSTSARVDIAGVIANVRITQVYKNDGENTLEAIYIFPMSTNAAVHGMRMTIGDRIIEAEIKERNAARKIYEDAKAQGQTASLLEQQRPNVFQMNVANILPEDEIVVEVEYTELVPCEEKVYEFVYPTVVGPRYSTLTTHDTSESEKWVQNPYLHDVEDSTYDFSLEVNIRTGIPISKLHSPSHEIDVDYTGRASASMSIMGEKSGNKDFVLKYQLAGNRIDTGLLLYPGEEENFFLMMMEPPDRVQTDAIVPREYIFIVDVSGSMHGFPLDTTKALMKDIIAGLNSYDYINVLLFAGGNAVLSEQNSLQATEQNKKKAIDWIMSRQGGGGTQILPALKRALNLPGTDNVSRTVVIATDGYVNVEPQTFELIRKNLNKANLFAFGIGSSVNRHLIEGMARVGLGEPFVVLNPEEAPSKASKFRKYIESPVLTNINVSFEGFRAYDVEPVSIPDLFAYRPIVVFGKYTGSPRGKLIVEGLASTGKFDDEINVRNGILSLDNEAIKYLWARERIKQLDDLNNLHHDDERIEVVTDLGLKYHLMTKYTSFVAVDKLRRSDGSVVTVKQPLPLPEGVSDLAVGDAAQYNMGRSGGKKGARKIANGFALSQSVCRELVKAPKEECDEVKALIRSEISLLDYKGKVNKRVVENELNRVLQPEFSRCLNQYGSNLTTGKAITIYIKLNTDGNVHIVRFLNSNLGNSKTLEKCIRSVCENALFELLKDDPSTIKLKLIVK